MYGQDGSSLTFADLFAGIGGMRLGFEETGAECVFTSEIDQFARQSYAKNFNVSDDAIAGDIRGIRPSTVADHDVLLAGFPCQPFSLAGVSKKRSLGRAHGFQDKAQGTLFFKIAEIIDAKRPRAFLLENVKNLRSHDGGRTLDIIRGVLAEDLKYSVSMRVFDASIVVPQRRERMFIVGTRADEHPPDLDSLELPTPGPSPCLGSVLHPEDGTEAPEEPYTFGSVAQVNSKYTLSPKLWAYLQAYAQKHRAAGNGFGFGLVGPDDRARTLSARYHKDGSEILIRQSGPLPRRLTPREAARVMGFDTSRFPEHQRRYGLDPWAIPVSDTQAYRQFGNAVVPALVARLAEHLVDVLQGSPARGQRSGALARPLEHA